MLIYIGQESDTSELLILGSFFLFCFREEVFGPVAPLIPFKTEEEAIHLANDTNAGSLTVSSAPIIINSK